MEPLAVLTLAVTEQVAHRELRSALPDAPVVPHRAPVGSTRRLRRTRTATAAALHRAAHRIAPA